MNHTNILADSWCSRNRPESMNTDWGQSLLAYGLMRAVQHTGNASAHEYLRRWLTYHLGSGVHPNYFVGSWSIGLLYPDIPNLFPEFRWQLLGVAEEIYEFILRKAIRNGGGVILHNVDLPNIYIDTLYYSAPILAKLGAVLGRNDWREEAMHQFNAHLDILRDEETGFWIHCEENRSEKRSEGAWARGNGWVAMTCAELLPYFPKGTTERKLLAGVLSELLKGLQPYQTRGGLWRTIIDDPSAYEETSASAMFAFGLQKAQAAGIRIPGAEAMLARVLRGLRRSIDSEGRFLGTSEGTWPGTIAYYKSLDCGEWWWGTGAALLAFSCY